MNCRPGGDSNLGLSVQTRIRLELHHRLGGIEFSGPFRSSPSTPVETASLRDFPQQLRLFEIFRNSDGTVSICATNVDPVVQEGSPAAKSRAYAIGAQQIFNNAMPYLPTGTYNAELVVPLTPEMQAKLQQTGKTVRK